MALSGASRQASESDGFTGTRAAEPSQPLPAASLALVQEPPRARAGAGATKQNIIWLASYPKSGNTWVRVFIHNFMRELRGEAAGAQDINALSEWTLREGLAARFERHLGKSPNEASAAEIAAVRWLVQAGMAEGCKTPIFVKTHNAVANVEGYATVNFDVTDRSPRIGNREGRSCRSKAGGGLKRDDFHLLSQAKSSRLQNCVYPEFRLLWIWLMIDNSRAEFTLGNNFTGNREKFMMNRRVSIRTYFVFLLSIAILALYMIYCYIFSFVVVQDLADYHFPSEESKRQYFEAEIPTRREIETYLHDSTILMSYPPNSNSVTYFGADRSMYEWYQNEITKGIWWLSPLILKKKYNNELRHGFAYAICRKYEPDLLGDDRCRLVTQKDKILYLLPGSLDYAKGDVFNLSHTKNPPLKLSNKAINITDLQNLVANTSK